MAMKKIMYLSIIILASNTFAQTDVFDNLLFRFKCNAIDSIAYNQGGGVDINTKIATLGDWNGDGMDEFLLISCSDVNTPTGSKIEGYRYMIFEGGNPPSPMPKYHWFVDIIGILHHAETEPIIYDFNDDGYLDIYKYRLSSYTKDTIDIFYGGPNFDTLPDLSVPVPGEYVNRVDDKFFYGTMTNLGDFNGDGVKELILTSYLNPFSGGGKYGFLLFLPLTNPFSTTQYYLGLPDTLTRREGFSTQILTSGDINGDGYTDVLMQTDTLNSNNNISYTKSLGAKLIFGNPQYSMDNYVFFSEDTIYATEMRIIPDINGDGMAELMWTKELPGSYVQISFGKSGEGHVLTRDVSFPLTGTALKTPKLLGDVNNDGYYDLGFVAGDITGSLVLLGGPTPVIGRRYTDSYHRHMGQVGDINGDGIDDFAAGEYHGNGGGNACQKLEWGQPLYYMIWSGDTTALNPSGIEDEFLPEGYNIEINPYPNPFNPEVKIEYLLPETGEVNLSVFSSLGEEIITKNLSLRNKGKNETTLDFSGLNVPSGVYLLRLTLQTQNKGTMVKTTKLAFMK
jgi:hypothetical protein